ncbi:MAG: pantoate--beta-alanine ligase [Bacteroidales bacterium]
MEIFQSVSDLRKYLAHSWENGQSIGFVPTMGALHLGHLSLIAEAKKENDLVVCSIFVNPIQFNNPVDLKNYPRMLEQDIQKLTVAECNILFAPPEQEVFPEPVVETFDFGDLDKVMEGKFRPGHFHGVAVVVKRLFEIVKPTRAYFGLKDYQQLLIIHKMTKEQNLPVEIIPCHIIREESGLAMSSRNERLSPGERKQAAILYEVLKMVRIRSGYSTIKETHYYVEQQFKKNKHVRLEYFEIVDMYSLKPLQTWTESNTSIACIAAWVGEVRLIDNMILFS